MQVFTGAATPNVDTLIRFSEFCHNHTPTIGFINGAIRGVAGFAFVNVGPNHIVKDTNGELCRRYPPAVRLFPQCRCQCRQCRLCYPAVVVGGVVLCVGAVCSMLVSGVWCRCLWFCCGCMPPPLLSYGVAWAQCDCDERHGD